MEGGVVATTPYALMAYISQLYLPTLKFFYVYFSHTFVDDAEVETPCANCIQIPQLR